MLILVLGHSLVTPTSLQCECVVSQLTVCGVWSWHLSFQLRLDPLPASVSGCLHHVCENQGLKHVLRIIKSQCLW